MSEMKVIYVAGPFRASNPDGTQDMFRVQENIMRAMKLSLEVWKRGHAAVCPHSNTMFFTGAAGCADEVWLTGDIEILKRCDALLATDDWTRSRGAIAEVQYAFANGIPVLRTVDQLTDWLAGQPVPGALEARERATA